MEGSRCRLSAALTRISSKIWARRRCPRRTRVSGPAPSGSGRQRAVGGRDGGLPSAGLVAPERGIAAFSRPAAPTFRVPLHAWIQCTCLISRRVASGRCAKVWRQRPSPPSTSAHLAAAARGPGATFAHISALVCETRPATAPGRRWARRGGQLRGGRRASPPPIDAPAPQPAWYSWEPHTALRARNAALGGAEPKTNEISTATTPFRPQPPAARAA